ncbi:MAG: D-sedoheptulose-7-phosphate isomerase [Kiritimatiellia bacterium]
MCSIEQLIERYSDLEPCRIHLQAAFSLLRESLAQGGKLLVCGNGGSAADSEHIVGELMKGFMLPRPVPEAVRRKLVTLFPEKGNGLADHLQGALPAMSLVSQTALITAVSNDVDPEMVFAQQVYGYGRPGDTVIALSTSGNSNNVLQAVRVGRALGLHTLGLSGPGGALATLCEVTICVPAPTTADIQERHISIYHTLCAMLEQSFFGAQAQHRST